jgi:hypothetical protein
MNTYDKTISVISTIKTTLRIVCILGVIYAGGKAQAQDAPMLINYGVNGSWYDPETSGQGLVLDLIPSSNTLVAYWFTYPVAGQGREWYVATGDISGDSAELTVYQTDNGLFDQISMVGTNSVGSASLTFTSCTQASWAYNIDTQGLAGQISLQRLAPDSFCEQFLAMANTNVVSHSNAWVDIHGVWLFEGCVNLEDSDSHGDEVFSFTETTATLEIERFSQPNCQGTRSLQVLNLEMQRFDKTLAFLEGDEVIANRFIMVETNSGQEFKQLIYVDDRGPSPVLTHGDQNSPPDADGFPTQIPPLLFDRVDSGK